MKQILKQFEIVEKILGKQKVTDGNYRASQYAICFDYEGVLLLYNTLTGEFLSFDDYRYLFLKDVFNKSSVLNINEFKSIFNELKSDNLDIEAINQLWKELIFKRYLIPEGFDEFSYAKQLNNIINLTTTNKNNVISFKILTTTDCNARCFYCYEIGCKKINMTEKTAYDIVNYIIKVHGDEEVRLNWFGGEPLYNMHIIDVICEGLKNNNIKYSSTMISNGYLFDEETIDNACKNWHLKRVQITLDGTEEIYNKRKAYIYTNVSPYKRVMKNINLLIKHDIKVNIRLNLNEDNKDDLIKLVNELGSKYKDNNNLKIYCALLKEYGHKFKTYTDFDGFNAENEINAKIKSYGMLRENRLPNKPRINNCMADNNQAIMFIPDGKIGKCEHHFEDKLIGSIDKSLDVDGINYWKEKLEIKECSECPLYPTCTILKHCPTFDGKCTEYDRLNLLQNFKNKMINEYEISNRYDDKSYIEYDEDC